jgi:hypothetical protein
MASDWSLQRRQNSSRASQSRFSMLYCFFDDPWDWCALNICMSSTGRTEEVFRHRGCNRWVELNHDIRSSLAKVMESLWAVSRRTLPMRMGPSIGSLVVHGLTLLSMVNLCSSDQAYHACVKRNAHNIPRQGARAAEARVESVATLARHGFRMLWR